MAKTDNEYLALDIVILAKSHNPTLIHPDFLASRSIVPGSWEAIPEGTICSLPFSSVAYTNGITIQVDPSKLIVRQEKPAADLASSSIQSIVENYVRTLPAIPYEAMGINVTVFREMADPENWMLSRFVKEGKWFAGSIQPIAAGLSLIYDSAEWRATYRLDVAQQPLAGSGPRNGVQLRANYHISAKGVDGVSASLKQFPAAIAESGHALTRILD